MPGWGPFQPLVLLYAWEDFPQCALYNSAGLPAPPFKVTVQAEKVELDAAAVQI